MYKYMEVIMLK